MPAASVHRGATRKATPPIGPATAKMPRATEAHASHLGRVAFLTAETPVPSETIERPTTTGTQIAAAPREKEIDAQGRAYATGRRKNAVARVWVKLGTGKITINGRDQKVYFARPTQQMVIQQPFDVSQRRDQFDVIATVSGGGLSGQAGAVRHGISQALAKFEPELRGAMKHSGFLTRDSRVVERKKYGRAGARRRFQFSKR